MKRYILTALMVLLLVLAPLPALPQWPGSGWVPPVPNMANPLLKGLQHWWKAVPGLMGGDKLYDLVPGTLGHLTLTNMAYSTSSGWSAGSRPTSLGQLNFDGTNDYARGTQDAGQFTDTVPYTLCVWLNATTLASGTQVVVGTYDGTAGIFTGVTFWWSHGGSYPKFMLGDIGGYEQEVRWNGGSWPIAGGTWQHWCGTRTGVGGGSGMSLYYNGVLQGVAIGGNASFLGGGFSSTLRWNMGANCCAVTGNYFQGSVDEVLVWFGRALTEMEIAQVYQQTRLGATELLPAIPTLVAAPVAGNPGSFFPFFSR